MLCRILFVTVLSLCAFTVNTKAQSAVYFCSETGIYGFCYGGSSEMATRECAYKNCIKSGGTKPQYLASTVEKGYGAICIGTDYLDQTVIGCAMGYPTQDEADQAARDFCAREGGTKLRIKEQWHDQ